MPQNIHVAVIGQGENLPHLIRAIIQHGILAPENLYISQEDPDACAAAEECGAVCCVSSAAAVVKSEIVLVCASRQAMSAALAPISQCTRGRTLVTVCDSAEVDLDFVRQRVVSGTEIVIATLHRDENGALHAQYTIDRGVRLFLHQPCRDMVNTLCS